MPPQNFDNTPPQKRKVDWAVVMGAFYIIAGINHFFNPEFYLKALEGFPFYSLLNIISGLAEIFLGIGVCFTATRKISAWGIILLLITIFPGNINMAIQWQHWGSSIIPLLVRLPFQLLLIWWAWKHTRG